MGNWTALVTEYLIIGGQTIVWVALLAVGAGILEPQEIAGLSAKIPAAVKTGLATAFFLSIVYSVGMMVDTLAFALVTVISTKWVRHIWITDFKGPSITVEEEKKIGSFFFSAEDEIRGPEGERNRLLRRRGRVRVFRSTALQGALIVFGLYCYGAPNWVTILVMGVWIFFIPAYLLVHYEYVRMVARQAKQMVARQAESSENQNPKVDVT